MSGNYWVGGIPHYGINQGNGGSLGWRHGERKIHYVKYNGFCFIPYENGDRCLKQWKRSLPKRGIGQLGRMRKECRRVTSPKEQYKGGVLLSLFYANNRD